MLMIFGVVLTSLMSYSVTNGNHATRSKAKQVSYTLAEAGINNASSVLWEPTNNALNPNILGSAASPKTNTYAGGTISWYGVLNQQTGTWTITSKGSVANSPTTPVTTTLTAYLHVSPSYTSPPNSQIWNYMYARRTGNTCDQSMDNSVNVKSPFWIEGNLCLNTPSQITGGPLVVKGSATLDVNTNIGSAASPISEAHIVGGCKYKNGALHTPCQGPPGNADKVWATLIDQTPPSFTPPTPTWDSWYANANPGPKYGCYAPSSSGTLPTFDNDTVRNNSVPTAWNLTPATSYDCWTAAGELKWDASAKLLTVRGIIFIDGSAYINGAGVVRYQGQASLYLGGTFMVKNSSLCASISGGACDFNTWDPNDSLLLIMADGQGNNGVPAGDGFEVKSSSVQAGAWTTYAIEFDTTSSIDGPMDAGTIIIGNSLTTHTWPLITELPPGTPGLPNVYAAPGSPYGYSG